MKIKHVGFIEQHVEKFILAGGVVLALVIFWLFGMGEPYAVDIDRRKNVKPGEVEKVVLDQAVALERAINKTESPLRPVEIYDFTELFRKRLGQPMVVDSEGKPITRLSVSIGEPGLGREVIAPRVEQLDLPYFATTPPGPQLSEVETNYAVLGQIADDTIRDAFLQLVGDRQPPDFRYVEITGEYDWEAWRERLLDENIVPEGTRILPEDWWRNLMLISDVRVERQVWIYDSARGVGAGAWSEAELLDPVPGAVTYRGVTKTFLEDEARNLIRTIRQSQTAIAEPTLPVEGAEGELGPNASGALTLNPEEQERLTQLNEQIVDLRSQIEGARTRGGNAGPALRRLRPQMEKLQRERDGLLGIDTTARSRPEDRARGRFGRPDAAPELEESEAPTTLVVRGYDLSAEPGQIYRYRLRVDVISPLFRRNNLVPAQSAAFKNKIALESDPSDWSDRIRVEQEKEFFFVKGSPPDVATFEVWTVFNGKRRSESFNVRPGDQIGGEKRLSDSLASADVDLSIDAIVVDTTIPITPGRSTTSVTLLDLETGSLFVRELSEDRDSERRDLLREEESKGLEERGGGPGGEAELGDASLSIDR